jgi:hypothetical protein
MERCLNRRLIAISIDINKNDDRVKPYFTHDNNSRIRCNKRTQEREIKSIFTRYNKDIYKVYRQYVTATRKIVLHTEAELDGKVPYDNFYCIMNTHITKLVSHHFIFETFEKYRGQRSKHGVWPPAERRDI